MVGEDGGGCIHDLVHSETYWRENAGGFVLRIVVQAVSQGWGQKDIPG